MKKSILESETCFDGSQGVEFLLTSQETASSESCAPTEPNNSDENIDDEFTKSDNTTFLNELRTMGQSITDNKELFGDIAKNAIIDLMRQGVENEKKSNDYEFDPDDVNAMVDFMFEQI